MWLEWSKHKGEPWWLRSKGSWGARSWGHFRDFGFTHWDEKKHLACNTGALASSFFVCFASFSLIPFETFSPSPSGHNLCLHTCRQERVSQVRFWPDVHASCAFPHLPLVFFQQEQWIPFVLRWDVPSSLTAHCPSPGEPFLPWTSLRPHHLSLLAPPCLSASLDPFPCPLLSFSAPVIFALPSSARSPSPPCSPCAARYRSLPLIFHPGQSRTLILQRWMSRQNSCQRMP